jgi:hypothetical protein
MLMGSLTPPCLFTSLDRDVIGSVVVVVPWWHYYYYRRSIIWLNNSLVSAKRKLKKGVLWVMRSASFSDTMCSATYFRVTRKKAWNEFRLVLANFLVIIRAKKYNGLFEDMLYLYHKVVFNVSLKTHTLRSHLHFFPDNYGMSDDEHGERFHMEIATLEKRYQGQWSTLW